MKEVLVLILALGLAGSPLWAQTPPKGGTKAPAAPAPAPAAAKTGIRAGTLGLNGTLGTASSTLGADYYLDGQLYLRGSLGLGFSSTTSSQNIAPASAFTVTSPRVSLGVLALAESRVSPAVTWAWGGGLGLGFASEDRSDTSGKQNKPVFALTLTGAADAKYWLAPGVAVFVEPAVTLFWEPVRANVITAASGTKVTDDNVSTLSLATSSSLGLVVYLN